MKKIIILKNGSREEACKKFDEVKNSITDFSEETVSICGNVRNLDKGWNVVKSIF